MNIVKSVYSRMEQKGKHLFKRKTIYILFKDNLNLEKYLIGVSKFYYDKIIKYRTGNHRLSTEIRRWDDTQLNEQKNVMLVMSIIICFHVTFLRMKENCI